jgi:RNA polymerase sigma factor (sigma-70 family)
LGVVARRTRNFAAAEDAVQEALLSAYAQWPEERVPANPRGWLVTVALRRLVDEVRSDAARRRREAEYVVPESTGEEDDSLTLLFLCCHPALTNASAIALTLRAVGGLTTAEIAQAFLVPEATMAQRISRAKETIRASGLPFAMPAAGERAGRLRAVLHVLYLIFNEGYVGSAGNELQRRDLAAEAIRLARLLRRLLPGDGDVAGLLALLLLTDARRAARTGPMGELIPLDEQDRALWDRGEIAEGVALVSEALASGAVGTYSLQAAISAVHDEAARAEDTDWPQILALYQLLRRMGENPMVELNYAVAVAMVRGPEAGLALVGELEGLLAGHYRLEAVRGHLLERTGDRAGARAAFLRAVSGTGSLPERSYLLGKAAAMLG